MVIDGCDTFAKLFRQNCLKWGDAIAMREKDFGIWGAFTWSEYYERARQVGVSLLSLGLRPGDVVSIISEDNKEWVFSDLGTQGIRCVCHGLYPTLQSRQMAFQLNDSKARVLFVEDEEQLDKFLEQEAELTHLEHVVVYDMEGLRRFSHPKVMSWRAFLELGDEDRITLEREWDKRIDAGEPEDLAILIYTSGTTGNPKGAEISNRFMMAQANNHPHLPFGPGDELLTFLPLCHAAERIISVAIPIRYGATINFAESGETFAQDIQEVAPTAIFAVPRVWEKFYSRINFIMKEGTPFGRKAYETAIKLNEKVQAGGASVLTRALARLMDYAVLRNIRIELGLNRTRTILSGAAPISPNLLSWFKALGVGVQEAYGQTETGIITATVPGQSPVGSVGRAFPGVEVKIAEDGEILARSPSNYSGYHNAPEKTAETVVDGWIHTGDIGKLDDNGDLYILDRKKDIIITAGGKNITPSLMENELKFSPYISDAVVIGDKRKYLTALIMIDQENVEKYAQEHRIPFTDYKSLCRNQAVEELIDGEIASVNKGFASVEQVKKFRLIDILLTADDEELTPTMKLKRKVVEEKYGDLIASMY
ncbi:long-chain fatty acid--CoA ligase [Thalassovita sp.]|uniref:AMP-dependent synthetase/ligase n=1 Tax=Thalassovita sp. TaxID=1979401 RepID=UPI00288265AA|nr:long-chain fatty acid--CoA ligase [Thalassovita sp.]MDF1804644.1 long-chain fatty acid--CoA ligase [Thalassovita sp.]